MAAALGVESSGRALRVLQQQQQEEQTAFFFLLSFLASPSPSLFLSPAAGPRGCGGGSRGGVNSTSPSRQVPSCSIAGEVPAARIPLALCPKTILTHPRTYKHPAERPGANACPEMVFF